MTAKIHRMNLPNIGEGVLHIGSGSPYVVDDEAKYEVGSYIRFGRKAFVYAKVGTNGVIPDQGAKTSWTQKIGQVAVQAIALINATEIKITSNVDCTVDELVGGEVLVFADYPGNTFTRTIIGNDAVVSQPKTLTLQLDSPIPIALDTGDNAEVIRNPYMSVENTSQEWGMVMGMPVMAATSGKYVFLQVEGISWCAPASEVGDAADEQLVVFAGDGSLRMAGTGNYESAQIAGVVICGDVAGSAQGAPFIMLQIAH